jgi:hypothetical protein
VILFSTVSRRAPLADNLATGRYRFWDNWQLDGRSLFRRLAWLGMGLLVYLSLPLRAVFHPPVNWGNPVTLENFGWLVSGRLYQEELFVLALPSIWMRIQSAAALLLDQFGLLGLIVSLTGLVVFFSPSAVVRNTLWMSAAFSIFAIGYATDDSYVYLIPAVLSFAVWIGSGLNGLMEGIARRFPKIGLAFGPVFLAYLFIAAGGHWPQVDASRDLRAEQFGEAVLAQAPADALVFAQGDRAVFTLWYFHYALRERADLVVIASDLLHFTWYQDMLKRNYPALEISGPFPFYSTIIASNPERPVCYIQYYEQAVIRCGP